MKVLAMYKKIFLILILLISCHSVAYAIPTYADAMYDGAAGFFLLVIPALIFAAYKLTGPILGTVISIGILAVCWYYPKILLIIDGICCVGMLLYRFLGDSDGDHWWSRY